MLTHLDVLNDVETVKICKRYVDESCDRKLEKSLPANIEAWEKLTPEFIEIPGWQSDVSTAEEFEDLPVEAQGFVRNLEQISKKKIEYVSVNDEREDGILRILR